MMHIQKLKENKISYLLLIFRKYNKNEIQTTTPIPTTKKLIFTGNSINP